MSIMKGVLRKGFSLLVKVSPKIASEVIYFKVFKKRLNLKNPTTFNEKVMWLKLYEDDSLKRKLTDKYLVREFINELGYSELLIELIGVYSSVEEIDFGELPNSFVMKCTHGSGFNIICSSKENLDVEQTRLLLKKWLKTDYSLYSSEPHYASIKPRILVEKFLDEPSGRVPIDYKFHCFHGEPQVIEVVLDRGAPGQKHVMYNCNWDILPYTNDSMNIQKKANKPEKLGEMLDIVRKLSKLFTYVRVDLYFCCNEIFFGELTFTPAACLDTDLINEGDYQLGKLLDLTKCNPF